MNTWPIMNCNCSEEQHSKWDDLRLDVLKHRESHQLSQSSVGLRIGGHCPEHTTHTHTPRQNLKLVIVILSGMSDRSTSTQHIFRIRIHIIVSLHSTTYVLTFCFKTHWVNQWIQSRRKHTLFWNSMFLDKLYCIHEIEKGHWKQLRGAS